MNRNTLYLVRGCSGSGKTTLAKKLLKIIDAKHFEADMFFMDKEDNYNFNPSKLKQAHTWCRESAHEALKMGSNVIVSNTFTRIWEMQPYLDLFNDKELVDVNVVVITCTGEYDNVHDVPESVVQNMRNRWEAYKGEYSAEKFFLL